MNIHLLPWKCSSRVICAMLLCSSMMVMASPSYAQSTSRVNTDGTMQDPGFLNAQNTTNCANGQAGCPPGTDSSNNPVTNSVNSATTGASSTGTPPNGTGSVTNSISGSLPSSTGTANGNASGNTPAGNMTGNASAGSATGIGAGIKR